MSFYRHFVALGCVAASRLLLSSYTLPPFGTGRLGQSKATCRLVSTLTLRTLIDSGHWCLRAIGLGSGFARGSHADDCQVRRLYRAGARTH